MILGIVQARLTSTRLPQKVLLPILGKPMLLRQIERVKRVTLIDYLIVATSHHETDDPIEQLCTHHKIACFRGNLHHVLDRFYQAALPYQPQHIVRLTGDCPLIDPMIIDQVIHYHLQGGYDYTSNVVEPSFPDGLDVEVFRFSCLEEAWKESDLPSQHEHVTPFLLQHPERFKIGSYKSKQDLSSLRWTVDKVQDYTLVKTIYEGLYPEDPCFGLDDILSFLEQHPHVNQINHFHTRKKKGNRT